LAGEEKTCALPATGPKLHFTDVVLQDAALVALVLALAFARLAVPLQGLLAGLLLVLGADDWCRIRASSKLSRARFYAQVLLVIVPARVLAESVVIPAMEFMYSASSALPFKISQDGEWVMRGVVQTSRRHPYGAHPREHLDVLEPAPAAEARPPEPGALADLVLLSKLLLRLQPVARLAHKAPVTSVRQCVVFIHGGGFVAGESAVQVCRCSRRWPRPRRARR
jgi:hypothetical protein